jgi:hypothetical protein
MHAGSSRWITAVFGVFWSYIVLTHNIVTQANVLMLRLLGPENEDDVGVCSASYKRRLIKPFKDEE